MPEQLAKQAPSHAAINPDAATRMLDEAWAYYTPGAQPTLPETQYEELPTAT
jgi:hypothetical protein